MIGLSWNDEFRGKRVVLAGAAGSFGRWFADAFARAGASLALVDLDAAGLEDTARRGGLGAEGFTVVADLTDEAAVDALAARVRGAWRAPDAVINAAGIFPTGWLLDLPAADWDRMMAVNLRAPFLVARAMARLMVDEGRGGAIVNLTSNSARVVRPGNVAYGVSKAGLHQFTIGLAVELARHRIRVNAVEPGYAARPGTPPETIRRVAEAMPLGDVGGPHDTASAVLFLCSGAARLITGAYLNVDGGWPLSPAAVDPAFNGMSGQDAMSGRFAAA